MSNHYEIPSWAGKPAAGLHLDVLKDDKLVQKLMIDEKKCYLFGRNPQMNDFCIDHASCSRVHAAFVYHKHLNIAYLVDLGSTHGTFIGSIRLEPHKPTQLQINSSFHFGASTRYYTLRERPSVGSRTNNIMEDIPMMDTSDGTYLGLPESQTDLDNLTEYNTAHNRRISMLGIADESSTFKKNMKNKRKRKGVQFNEDEIVINPEDIDPNIGRFRNLVQSTVVPVAAKRSKMDVNSMGLSTSPSTSKTLHSHSHSLVPSLYHGIDDHPIDGRSGAGGNFMDMDTTPSGLTTKLGIILPNPAPDVHPVSSTAPASSALMPPPMYNSVAPKNVKIREPEMPDEPKKKKYAKEQWPGRKPLGLGGF